MTIISNLAPPAVIRSVVTATATLQTAMQAGQGPAGRNGIDAGDSFQAVNTSPATMTRGMPVCIQTADGTIKRARALGTAENIGKIVGLLFDATVPVGVLGRSKTSGYFQATVAEWAVVTGEPGGLTPGALYWLGGDFAQMRKTWPDPVIYPNPWIIEMGVAISATEFVIRVVVKYQEQTP